MKITQANQQQASTIAKLIMLAMNHECCNNLAGANHNLDDFEKVMNKLVEMDYSQYSHRNTLVALTDKGEIAGICVSYNGAELHNLRKAFIEEAKNVFGIDYSDIPDEAMPDELYIDSLAVCEKFRCQGIATKLLKATIKKAEDMGIKKVGLLVDKGNPKAEKLYNSIGFEYQNDDMWAGHKMKHLQVIKK